MQGSRSAPPASTCLGVNPVSNSLRHASDDHLGVLVAHLFSSKLCGSQNSDQATKPLWKILARCGYKQDKKLHTNSTSATSAARVQGPLEKKLLTDPRWPTCPDETARHSKYRDLCGWAFCYRSVGRVVEHTLSLEKGMTRRELRRDQNARKRSTFKSSVAKGEAPCW